MHKSELQSYMWTLGSISHWLHLNEFFELFITRHQTALLRVENFVQHQRASRLEFNMARMQR